ncbi:MAG: hypothetical protein U9O94_09105, partial [Nanoarchaeota archaeon]|nr:hypothetical protein [Nanoarchaeota archaeon]
MSYWNLIPAASNLAMTAINKPKKISMDDTYLNRYLADLRGDKISGTMSRKVLEGESKIIGKQAGRSLRHIQAQEATPGQKTQAIVDLYKGSSEALGEASGRAGVIQSKENAQITQRQRDVEEYIARTKTQIEMQNEMAEDKWKSDMLGSGVNLAASGVAAYGQRQTELQKGFEAAKAGGLIGEDITKESYIAQMKATEGMSDPAIFNKMIGEQQAAELSKSQDMAFQTTMAGIESGEV